MSATDIMLRILLGVIAFVVLMLWGVSTGMLYASGVAFFFAAMLGWAGMVGWAMRSELSYALPWNRRRRQVQRGLAQIQTYRRQP